MSNGEGASSPTTEARTGPIIRDFTSLIGQLGYGNVSRALAEKVEEIIQAITEEQANTGRKSKGELTLKLKFTADEVVEIVPEITAKLPKPVFGKAVFWATPENHLATTNPKQGTLFRDVSGGAPQPARSVSAPSL